MTTSVVIADGARARFFRVAEPDQADYASGPRLREKEVLANPDGQLTGTELYSNLKSGRKRAPGGGPAHGLDDHRIRHGREIDRRFARRIADATKEHVTTQNTRRIILVAPPNWLGMLRDLLAGALPPEIEVEELPNDLSWHALPNIEDVLERRGLLSPRELPEHVHRAPGQPTDGS